MVLSNRLQENASGLVDHAVAQSPDAVGLDLDDIAGFEPARRIEAGAGAGRRARDDHVAGHQRGEGRDVVDQIAEGEDQPAGAVVLARLAVDAGGQPDVGDLRFDPLWARATGRSSRCESKFLPCVTLNLAWRTQSRMVPSLQSVRRRCAPAPCSPGSAVRPCR